MLETLLPERAFSLAPDDSFLKVNCLTPIYHIHGIKTIPSSIIITNEDYVSLFRPNDYRQSRLPFLIKESLVLMVGYALGDINVISAVDWSKNVYTNVTDGFDYPIIQLLYTENSKEKPYRDPSGVIIFEINNVKSFFNNLIAYFDQYRDEYSRKVESVRDKIIYFSSDIDNHVAEFVNDATHRIDTIKFVEGLSPDFRYIYTNYKSFLENVIEILKEESAQPYAFDAYDKRLKVLLDIIENMGIKNMPEAFFQLLADSLCELAVYIGDKLGDSYAANNTWNSRKGSIPKDFLGKLKDYAKAKSRGASRLNTLLKGI